MPVLCIKEFDADLKRALKSAAANKGKTLQEFLEQIVADALGFETKPVLQAAPKKRA